MCNEGEFFCQCVRFVLCRNKNKKRESVLGRDKFRSSSRALGSRRVNPRLG